MRRLTDLDLRQVHIFRAIADCKSLAGAELVLNLSQSRISANLADLEARVGARLCRRGRSGFALTKAGAVLYRASNKLFEAVDAFTTEVGAVASGLKRVLRLGTVDAVITNPDLALPYRLRKFTDLYPSVVIDYLIAGPEELERCLSVGTSDLVISPCINRRSEFHYMPVIEERQSLYCGSSHPLFDAGDISIASLQGADFVARGYLHHQDLKRIGHRDARATVDMMEAQLILILSGSFIGYLPAHYAEAHLERGDLRMLLDEVFGYSSPFYLMTQRSKEPSSLVNAFAEICSVKASAAFTTTKAGLVTRSCAFSKR